MPLKITWKSLAGLLALAAGPAAGVAGAIPTNLAGWLTFAGALIVALERLADSRDFQTVTAAVGLPPAVDKHLSNALKRADAAEQLVSKWQTYARQLEARLGSTVPPPPVGPAPAASSAPPAAAPAAPAAPPTAPTSTVPPAQ